MLIASCLEVYIFKKSKEIINKEKVYSILNNGWRYAVKFKSAPLSIKSIRRLYRYENEAKSRAMPYEDFFEIKELLN